MYVNMYDGPHQRPHFEAIFQEAGIDTSRYKLRPHWGDADEDYGLILNNRSGMVIDPILGLPVISEPIRHPCYYPFSRALIDWNGDLLLCSNDWGRALVVGNVATEHLPRCGCRRRCLKPGSASWSATEVLSPVRPVMFQARYPDNSVLICSSNITRSMALSRKTWFRWRPARRRNS